MPGTNDADVTRRERLEIAPTAAVTTPSMLFDVTATLAGGEGDRRGGPSGGAGRLTTTAPAPSALLGKLEAFLPTMKRANDALEARVREDGGTDGVDIERVDDPDGERIEMDLGLGVVDLKTEDAVAAAEAVAGGQKTKRAKSDESEAPKIVIPDVSGARAVKIDKSKVGIEEL